MATQYTSNLPFFQVGIDCYPMDLDKLPSAIVDALQLVSLFLPTGYLLLT